jgi:S-DNA-T family DNA segregation ATPase FtsK/SpoIIIE
MAGTDSAHFVELELTVVVDGAEHDVVVAFEPSTAVTEITRSIAQHVGCSPEAAVWLERTGEAIDTEALRGTLDLRRGDRLHLGVPPTSNAPGDATGPGAELRVVGGPDAGRSRWLAPGEHVIGRDGSCALTIADPSLSRHHVVLRVHADGGVEVSDRESRNGTAVNGAALARGQWITLSADDRVEIGRTLLAIAPGAGNAEQHGTVDRVGSIAFNRPPRVSQPFTPRQLQLSSPPDEPRSVHLPLAASLVPVVLGVGLWAATQQVLMLAFAAFGPVMAIASWWSDRRGGRQQFRHGSAAFRRELSDLEPRLVEAVRDETRARAAAAPDAAEICARATLGSPELWERRLDDADFLRMRVGSCDQPRQTGVELPAGGTDTLREEALAVLDRFAEIPSVPVVVSPVESGPVGLCGDAGRVEAVLRFCLLQAAVLHSPRDLEIAVATSRGHATALRFARWLPHARGEHGVLDAPHLAAGAGQTRELLKAVTALVEGRTAERAEELGRAPRQPRPAVLLVVDGDAVDDRSLVSFLAHAHESGVYVLWWAADRRELPGECTSIVEASPEAARLQVTDVRSGTTLADVNADGVSIEVSDAAARALAPVRDVTAGSSGDLPRQVDLLSVLHLDTPTSEAVKARWQEGRSPVSAPIGWSAEGIVELDLRRDGPHALVAGMTGSGKSELLQSLVAGMAATAPPDRLTFLLIDYKGGAAFRDCVSLPHTVGMVTDLDGPLARRALVSLNAELRRREAILRSAGAGSLADLETADPGTAPPSLVIVIDEFATLAREVPEFVDGVVDVAQRGRSLGVHLVLATQRPGGVVSENIRANTNARIALRVASPTDSDDVIAARDAARISRSVPGRALLRTGHDELTVMQTAYGGGRTGATSRPGVVVHDLDAPPAVDPATAADSDLRRLVDAIRTATLESRVPAPRRPWLEPLADLIPLGALAIDPEPHVATIGLIDEPSAQAQRPLRIDFAQTGGLVVYGVGGTGKSTVLRTIAASLASAHSPEAVHLYAIDAVGRGLATLEALPHCGAVISGADEERIGRLFRMLRTEIEKRTSAGGSGGGSWPTILVLLDGYGAFADAFEGYELAHLVDAVPRLVADGRAVGIYFAIATERRNAVPLAVTGVISGRFVLRMADANDYATLGLDARTGSSDLPPGRGFLDGGLEAHIAVAGDDPSVTSQDAAIGQIGAAWSGWDHAPAVGALPAQVLVSDLPLPTAPMRAVVGLGDTWLTPIELDLSDRHVLVAGPYRSGRSTALGVIARSLRAATSGVRLELLCARRSPLPDLDVWDAVAVGSDACSEAARRIAVEVGERDGSEGPIVAFVDDATDLADGPDAAAWEAIVRRGRDVGVRVVLGCESAAARVAFAGWIKEVRKDATGILLNPNPDLDGDLLGTRLPRRVGGDVPPGRGFTVRGGAAELTQVAY